MNLSSCPLHSLRLSLKAEGCYDIKEILESW